MGTEDQQRTALDTVREVQRAASIAHANAVYDALDQQWEDIDRSDRYDIAAETWRITADTDARLTEGDIARLAFRAADHLPSHILVGLVEIQFGEHEKKLTLADGHRLTWLPDDATLILGTPAADGIVDARMYIGSR